MKMTELKQKAGVLGVTPGKMKKAQLIHAIQQAEGYPPCFERSTGICPYVDCCFRDDCLKVRT
jgi:hypothetical protein